MPCIRKALPIVVAALAFVGPQVAWACHEATVCLKWQAKFNDDMHGLELAPMEQVPARGARFTLVRPAPEPPLSGVLDQDGCVTFDTQFGYGHKILVYAEAWVGERDVVANKYPVHITTRSDGDDGPFFWLVDLVGLAPNDSVTYPIPNETSDPVAQLIAAATEIIYRLGSPRLNVLPSGQKALRMKYTPWKANGRFNDPLEIEVGPDSFQEKFLIAHEIGHWLQNSWGAYFDVGFYPYDYEADEPYCQFAVKELKDDKMVVLENDAGEHGMRSAEFSTGAAKEGLAHFIAAVVFNDFTDAGNLASEDGYFHYYKDISTPSYLDFYNKGSLVSLRGGTDPETAIDGTLGGENRWVENRCADDWNNPLVPGVSSELDWLRFFWYFLTAEDDAPTVEEIMLVLKARHDGKSDPDYLMGRDNAYPAIRVALIDLLPAFTTRFEAANVETGAR